MSKNNWSTELSVISISTDGYLRLTFEEFKKIPLMHLISGLDEDSPTMAQEGAVFADCTGYTEWVSNTSPVISIGWDWVFQHSQIGGAGYKRVSKPKTNLMLVDMQQCDLRSFKTAALVERIIDEIDWQKVVQNWITTRYAAMPVNSDSCV